MPSALRSRAWLLLAATLVLQLVIVRSVRVLKHDLGATEYVLRKRSVETTDLLSLPYDEYYSSAPPALRPLIALGYLLILCFLFSFIGISASDFFCPNLSTIATYLGLNESTAGVTFLAFGNGSPDVFSTFAALNGGTFGLAIGELIGAASFIVSIVVGTIALIRPFHVPRHAFLRDVLFFTTAVLVLIFVLHDGRLTVRESGGMVILYIAYVIVVIMGNWWSRRRRAKAFKDWKEEEERILDGMSPLTGQPSPMPLPNLALPNGIGAHSPASPAQHNHPGHSHHLATSTSSLPSLPSASPSSPMTRPRTLGRLPSTSHNYSNHLSSMDSDYAGDTHRANFSLLGAIEFRDVVNTLRAQSSSREESPNRSPTDGSHFGNDYFGGATRLGLHRRSSSHNPVLSPGSTPESSRPNGRKRSASHHPALQDQISRPMGLSGLSGLNDRRVSAPEVPAVNPSGNSPVGSDDGNPWSDQVGNPATPIGSDPNHLTVGGVKPDNLKIHIPGPTAIPPRPEIPIISVIDPSGHQGPPLPLSSDLTNRSKSPLSLSESSSSGSTPGESRFRIRRRTRTVLRVLFPSLQSFRHKSYLGMIIAVLSVPAVLALTLTLPVVDDGRPDEGGVELPIGDEEPLIPGLNVPGAAQAGDQAGEEEVNDDNLSDRQLRADVGEELHHLVDGGFSPLHSPLGRISHSALRRAALEQDSQYQVENGSLHSREEADEEITKEMLEEIHQEESLVFYPALAAVQCLLGPMFCTLIVFSGAESIYWILLASGIAGTILGFVVWFRATDGRAQPWRLVRCFCGFICSMVWIAAIADEVVSVLQAVGEILGLSDAIIGLTIFAVGNSLADLVANVTVAQFAPAMAYAACFGGPMLNLLLGVGGSGTYHMLVKSQQPVIVDFSPTLWTSASGLVIVLVATAIVVPLNGYLIDRRWAACLIVAYLVLMTVNIIVEIKL